MGLIARLLPPRSYCADCRRPFYSDKRRPCRCGATARIFTIGLTDGVQTQDKVS